jgi:hypothetical protein
LIVSTDHLIYKAVTVGYKTGSRVPVLTTWAWRLSDRKQGVTVPFLTT